MREHLSNALTAVLVAGALVVSGLVVRKEVLAHQARRAAEEGEPAPHWNALLERNAIPAAGAAPVTVVVFGDYTCRYCAELESVLAPLERAYDGRVAFVRMHHPNFMGGLPLRAALAAECARAQGRYSELHRRLYESQPLRDGTPLDSLAVAAGVRDAAAFRRCVDEARTLPAVRRDHEWGERMGVSATPTLVVNGRRFVGAVPREVLERRIERALREAPARAR